MDPGPVRYLLTGDCRGIDAGTGAHDRHEQFGFNDLTGFPINIGGTVTGKVNKQFIPCLVVKAHDRIKGAAVPMVKLTELAAAVAVRMNGSVLFPEKLKRDPFLLHLVAKSGKVGKRLPGNRGFSIGIQKGFQRAVVQGGKGCPIAAGSPDTFKVIANGCR